MSFHARLQAATADTRATLLAAPILQRLLRGTIRLTDYTEFLQQAYHHVRHTVPLLMAACPMPPSATCARTALWTENT